MQISEDEDLVEIEVDMELVLNGSTSVLKEGFRPGGFMKQTAVFKVPRSQLKSASHAEQLATSVYLAGQDFLTECVTVVIDKPRVK